MPWLPALLTVLQSSGGQPMEKVKQFGGDTPLGRPGQPVEIAPYTSRWRQMSVPLRQASMVFRRR